MDGQSIKQRAELAVAIRQDHAQFLGQFRLISNRAGTHRCYPVETLHDLPTCDLVLAKVVPSVPKLASELPLYLALCDIADRTRMLCLPVGALAVAKDSALRRV